MTASQQPFGRFSLHAAFQGILPRIQLHAEIGFRGEKCPDRRAELIAEACGLAWKWFCRLAERGKDATQFPMALAGFAVRAAWSGRRVAGKDKAKDAMSPSAQQRHCFSVRSLPGTTAISHEQLYGSVDGQRKLDEFEEWLQDNTQTPIPDQVHFRVDWPQFFCTLTCRDRAVARFLSKGHSGKQAAEKFGLSPGRVTQLRQQWCREWKAFLGEPELAID